MAFIKKIITAISYFFMKLATYVLIPLAYWAVFAPIAICMKIFGKPFLPVYPKDRDSIDSYWLDAPEISKDMEKMKRQF